ncbi:hypothetical protein PG993_012511, partial [Apiospora rasikravindrae]
MFFLETHGVTVAGGRDADVGVGGFLLGGGISYFSGEMGLGCDTVVNYEVVLTNGTIVNANASDNSDLWRALKGGGSNFGIVTRYDMQTLPSRQLFLEKRVLSANYSQVADAAMTEFAGQGEATLARNALMLVYSYDARLGPDLHMTTIYVNTNGQSNASTAYDKVRSLPAILSKQSRVPMAKAADPVALNGKAYSKFLAFYNDPQIIHRCIELERELIQTLSHAIGPDTFSISTILQPLPAFWGGISKMQGGNMLGLDATDHDAVMLCGGPV